MSWSFYLRIPDRGLVNLRRELEEKNDDESKRALVAGDYLLSLGYSTDVVCWALLRLLNRYVSQPYLVHGDKDDYNEIVGSGIDQTYNVSPLFFEAFQGTSLKEGGIRDLNGMRCCVAAPILDVAITRMVLEPDKYRAMNPKNGWGNFEGALETLKTLRAWCEQEPDGQIEVY